MNRIAYIDGLRAIAVLSVVVYHAALAEPHLNRGGWLHALLGQGSHGVELFFVLSGFCLAYPTLVKLREGKGRFDVARYAAHRLVRIAPPYYIALALFIVVSMLVGYHVERLAPVNLLHQAMFLDRDTNFVNPSFWTLPIEMRWYVILPFALWAWVRAPKVFLIALVLVVLSEQTRAQSTDLFALPAFLFGILAADAFTRPTPIVRYALPLCIAAFAVTVMVSPTRDLHGSIQLAWEITAALFVIAAGANERLQQLLSLPALTFIGAASYSIYLMHDPIIEMLEVHGVNPAMAAIASVVAGVAFWAVAERPFVSSALRDSLLRTFEPLARRLLPRFGISDTIALERRPAVPRDAHTAPERVRPALIEEPAFGVSSS